MKHEQLEALQGTMSDLYDIMKGNAYPLATMVTGRDNPEAQREGYKDVFDLIMSDSDHPRQQLFLIQLQDVLSEKQRQILLDGMAHEYADAENWMIYVDRECG